MDPGDTRFEGISAQKFLLINPSLEVRGSWLDPRDVERDQEVAIPAPPPEPPPVVLEPEPAPPEVQAAPEPAPPEPATAPEPAPLPQAPPQGRLSPHLMGSNTAVQRGQMIPQTSKPEPPGSSWDAPIPTTDTDNVLIVKRGAKVRLG